MYDQVFFLLRSIFNKPVPSRRTFSPPKNSGVEAGRRHNDNLTSDYRLSHVSRVNVTLSSVMLCKMPRFPALGLQPAFDRNTMSCTSVNACLR